VYGANAFFGIINIVTRGAAESARAWGRVSINQIAGVIGAAGFAAGGLDRQLRGSVLAMNRFGENLSVPDVGSNLDGDGAYGLTANLVGSYGGTFGQLRAYRSRRDSPFAPYNGDPVSATPYEQYNTQLLVEGGHTRELSKRFTVAVRGYLNIYRFFDDIEEYDPSGTPNVFLDYGDATTAGSEVRTRVEVIDGGKLGITTGAEASYNQTKSRSFYDGDEANGAGGLAGVPLDFTLLGLYTEADTSPAKWLGATVGVRFDARVSDPIADPAMPGVTGETQTETRLSPRAALFLAKPEKFGLKLLYAEGFRNPSPFEGAFFDNTAFASNPDIGAERIRSFEGVLWAKPVPGLSTRLSAFYWDARDVIEQLEEPMPMDPMMPLLQFQNVGRFVTQGLEAEVSYRNSAGWYMFGGGALAKVGTTIEEAAAVEYGDVPDAAAIVAAGGVSTPRLADLAHLSTELIFVGRRPTRPGLDATGNEVASPDSPAWLGWNVTLYAPSIRGFDLTIGARNLLGKRDQLPAPGDYDRDGSPDTVVIPRIPGEGRELYAKLGYAF
jgi:iron complex outermembrane receptor protein